MTILLDIDGVLNKEKHNNLYLVDCKTGLTTADTKKIRKILNNM